MSARLVVIYYFGSCLRTHSGGTRWVKAPTPAPRSVSTDVYGWSFTALPSPPDAGLLACRELDDALGLTETADECLQESRGGRNVQHRLVGLLRQSVYQSSGRLRGYQRC